MMSLLWSSITTVHPVVDILAEYIIKHGEIDFEPVNNIVIKP